MSKYCKFNDNAPLTALVKYLFIISLENIEKTVQTFLLQVTKVKT